MQNVLVPQVEAHVLLFKVWDMAHLMLAEGDPGHLPEYRGGSLNEVDAGSVRNRTSRLHPSSHLLLH